MDGRCPGLLKPGQLQPGTYKLSFDTEGYWKKRGQESFYPYIEVRATGGQRGVKAKSINRLLPPIPRSGK